MLSTLLSAKGLEHVCMWFAENKDILPLPFPHPRYLEPGFQEPASAQLRIDGPAVCMPLEGKHWLQKRRAGEKRMIIW